MVWCGANWDGGWLVVLLPGFDGAGGLDFLVFKFRCFLVLDLDFGLVVLVSVVGVIVGGVPVSLWLMIAGLAVNSVVLFLSFDFCFLLMVFVFYCCVCWGRCAGCGLVLVCRLTVGVYDYSVFLLLLGGCY